MKSSITHVKQSNGTLLAELGTGETVKAPTLAELKTAIIASVERDGVIKVVSIVEESPANLPCVTKHFLRINYKFV